MIVPLLDLQAQYAGIEQEVRAAIDEVCASQRFIMGPKVETLEEQIAAYCQCAHGVGVSSGTDALLVALMALDVGPGDEVITTPYSFFATAGVIARLGARPAFCDVDPETYNLSPLSVAEFISDHCEHRSGRLVNRQTGGTVRVLMPVHLYGQTADMETLLDIAHDNGLKVVEDAAQAIGSEYLGGRRAGGMGEIGCFSFFPSKNLGAFGDAGMCTTNDPELAERMRVLRMHGSKPKYYHSLVGGNFRLDALQAAVLLVKLKHLDNWTMQRQRNADYYNRMLGRNGSPAGVAIPRVQRDCRHIYNQYVLRVERRDELRNFLSDANIGTEIYYPVPLHAQQCFADLGYRPDDFPEAALAARETLAIPIYPELTEAQQRYVVECIRSFYGVNAPATD
ncbi:MAG: DegT/DnrJ/EryC1/StrS family aminotransferase [Gammaproteobacteria bacterium]